MSCFFGCFRVKDSSSNLVTPSEPVAPRSKNALSSLFMCDDDSLRKGDEGQNRLPGEIDVREFEDEDKFSKSHGTSLETPVKIRNALEKWEDESAQNGAQKSLKFDSWLPNASMEKQSDEHCAGSFLDSPSSCLTDGHNTGGVSSSSVQRSGSETHFEQSRNESVRFHYASNRSSISSEQSVSAGAGSVTKPSPYPNTEKLAKEVLEDEDSASNHQSESVKLNDEDGLKPTPPSDLPVRNEMNDEGSLTSWFKPISAKQDGSNKQSSSISSQNRKPAADRPILGMVAAHWNEDEAAPTVPPKWWDGNGIPNSTNKYKEDQKVSWHATTFEERLEKALSEESLISQKKPSNMTPPFEFNESEETDTALSHFQSSPRLKSVVSF
ncbi:hypothetical protein C2S53_010781 [Perilla frutescens var. hirtella]|uniref:Protein JASON n=1 Tax=Perilla frutescens var. hirtella TaxID=608512 RepID=A0AAD4JQ65_PERFH|nr:hypothetical protein C2S53_010781 [Perilla frutescens var. hirtella]